MNNAELIDGLRCCAESTNIVEMCAIEDCPYHSHSWACIDDMLHDAADAIEAADKRIAELEAQLRYGTISNPERFKIYEYTVKDLILFAEICKRNNVKEEDMKQAAWNLEIAVRAYDNATIERFESEMTDDIVRFSCVAKPNFEKAFGEMMPNCGARMRGANDEQ